MIPKPATNSDSVFDKFPYPVKPAARQLRQFHQFPFTCRRRLLVNSIDEILKFRNGAADPHQLPIVDRESWRNQLRAVASLISRSCLSGSWLFWEPDACGSCSSSLGCPPLVERIDLGTKIVHPSEKIGSSSGSKPPSVNFPMACIRCWRAGASDRAITSDQARTIGEQPVRVPLR
jgi:hypothetical protein